MNLYVEKKTYRLLVVVEEGGTEKLLALLKNFIGQRSFVRLRLVVERRQLRRGRQLQLRRRHGGHRGKAPEPWIVRKASSQ